MKRINKWREINEILKENNKYFFENKQNMKKKRNKIWREINKQREINKILKENNKYIFVWKTNKIWRKK